MRLDVLQVQGTGTLLCDLLHTMFFGLPHGLTCGRNYVFGPSKVDPKYTKASVYGYGYKFLQKITWMSDDDTKHHA